MSRDSMVPWLAGAASGVALVFAGISSGRRWSGLEWMALLLGVVGLLAATIAVALRSRAELAAAERDERTRPALDELLAGSALDRAATSGASAGSPPYVAGMARWAAAVLELLDHAARTAADRHDLPTTEDLTVAREDTAALRDLLESSQGRPVGVNETASIHAICTLWETNQPRYEALAADIDPGWYRRWTARSVVERRLRHGAARNDAMVLPYSP